MLLSATLAFGQNNASENFRDFTSISLAIPADLEVTIEDKFSVEMKMTDEMRNKITIEKEGNNLKFRWKEKKMGNGYYSEKKRMVIRVSMPALEALNSSGSGDISVKNEVKTTNFNCSLAGSGDVRIEKISAENVKFNIAGSGDVSVDGGSAKEAEFNIAGSGDVEASGLKAQKTECNISGSGDIKCYAGETLKVAIAGSGDVVYEGSPANVKQSVIGSGSVTKR
jgi:hypothetical protein